MEFPNQSPRGGLLRLGAGTLVAVALILCLIGAPARAAAARAAERSSVDAATAKRIVGVVTGDLKRQALPGAIVGVARDGHRPWLFATGHADLRTLRPMRTDEHVRIGSVTKAFVTTLLLRLAQEGKLGLDQSIADFVPGVPGGEEITLRELANMTSGIADLFANQDFTFEYLTGAKFTPHRLVELGTALPVLFPPGKGWSYSNTNTVLLGIVIQKVTGESLASALRKRVFRPLRLTGSSLPSVDSLPKPFAAGYTEQNLNGWFGEATHNTPTATWAAGGMVSTVPDLLKAARLFGTGKPLLGPAAQRQRTDWVNFPPNYPGQRYGLGVFDFRGWIGHNGGIPGYTAISWYLPQAHLALVVSVNSDIHVGRTLPNYAYEPASEIGHLLTRILTPGHVAPAAVKVRGAKPRRDIGVAPRTAPGRGALHRPLPRILSASWGTEDAVGCPNGAQGLDNIPVTFNWFIKRRSIQPRDFRIVRSDGTTATPTCALQFPPDERDEAQTVNLIGNFGESMGGPTPVAIKVVGELEGKAPGARAWLPVRYLKNVRVDPLAGGPYIVDAWTLMPSIYRNDPNRCQVGTTFVRVMWSNGLTAYPTGEEVGAPVTASYRAIYKLHSGKTVALAPLEVADLYDHETSFNADNMHDLCLTEVPRGARLARVTIAADLIQDPNGDPNEAQDFRLRE
jgi:D-alanyl-D-alanine carboxypeptidase